MTKKEFQELNMLEKIAVKTTALIGTPASLIVHTILFIGSFCLLPLGVSLDKILLALTTAVSLEAIYLSLLIQMSVNRSMETISEVEEDIDDIQKDMDEISEDIEDIQKDVDQIEGGVDNISHEIEEIEDDGEAENRKTLEMLKRIEASLNSLAKEVENIKSR